MTEKLRQRRAELEARHEGLTVDDLLDIYAPGGISPLDWIDQWNMTIPEELRAEFLARRQHGADEYRKEQRASVNLEDSWARILTDLDYCACNGVGLIVSPFPKGHYDHNKIADCFCQRDAATARSKAHMWENSGMKAGQFQPTFTTYETDESEDHARAKQATVDWSQGRAHSWLLLLGTTGTGKTLLAKAATVAVLGEPSAVFYITATNLAEFVREAMRDGSEYVGMVQRCMTVPTLVLDDLGREHQTPFWVDRINRVIDYRSDRNLRTMVTSNHDKDELVEMFDTAFVSRLRQGNVCVITGVDRRTGEVPA